MKTLLFGLLISLGLSATVFAAKPEKLTFRQGQQKTAANGDLKVKFVKVTEDSRCPVNANCIWAGNAKVLIKVTDSRGRTKTFTANTFEGPKGDQFAGYAIVLTSLTPQPGERGAGDTSRYRAGISIERLIR